MDALPSAVWAAGFATAGVVGLAVAARRGLFSGSPSGRRIAVRPGPLLTGALGLYVALGVIGLAVAATLGGMARPGQTPTPEAAARAQGVAMVVCVPVALLAYWLATLAAGGADWRRAAAGSGQTVALRAAEGVVWGACLLPAIFALGQGAAVVSQWLGRPVDPAAHAALKVIIDPSVAGWARWVLVAVAVVGAPVVEEVSYRGLLQRGIGALGAGREGGAGVGRGATWRAVVLTSLVFAAMHAGVVPEGSRWPALAQVFALSIGLGLVAAQTGSVVGAVVMHALFNAVSVAAAVWGAGTAGA